MGRRVYDAGSMDWKGIFVGREYRLRGVWIKGSMDEGEFELRWVINL